MTGYRKQRIGLAAMLWMLLVPFSFANGAEHNGNAMKRFQTLRGAKWSELFYDACTQDWKDKWTLDGLKAQVKNDRSGMSFKAGPTFKDNSSHAVLWTKESFQGDLKIEYEYTRLDDATKCANIIYVQATGSGVGPYKTDIGKWRDMRKVPAMKTYFNHMNTYHISYAAYGMEDNVDMLDYIRARRYMPKAEKGLKGTGLKPDYFNTGLFKKGVPHKITIIKKDHDLFMYIDTEGKEMLCHWKTDPLPPIFEGRIGLRQMYTRSARYANFRVSGLSIAKKVARPKSSPDRK